MRSFVSSIIGCILFRVDVRCTVDFHEIKESQPAKTLSTSMLVFFNSPCSTLQRNKYTASISKCYSHNHGSCVIVLLMKSKLASQPAEYFSHWDKEATCYQKIL